MSVKAYNKEKESFVKIASLQSGDITVDKSDFVSSNVNDALSELKDDIKSMQSNIAWIYNNGTIGGGGSGTGTGGYTGIIQVENFFENKSILADTDAAEVKFKIVSKLNNSFTVKLTVGTTVKTVVTLPNVTNTVSFGQLSQGTFKLSIEAVDYTGFALEPWVGHFIKGLIGISSSFNDGEQYGMRATVNIPYTVNLSSEIKKDVTVQWKFDAEEPVTIEKHPVGTTAWIHINEAGRELSMGTHTVTVTASVYPDGITEYTVKKVFTFVVYDPNRISIYVPENARDIYPLNQTASIPFSIIAAPENVKLGFTVNWTLYKGSVAGGQQMAKDTVDVNSVSNGIISIFLDPNAGFEVNQQYTLSITAAVKFSTVTTELPYKFTFTTREISSAVTPWEPEKNSLIMYCNAIGKQSLSTIGNDAVWKNDALSHAIYKPGNCIVVNPIAKPFATTEEVGDNVENLNILRLWGESYAYVDFNIVDNWNNSIKEGASLQQSGCTVEFVYKCKSNGDPNAVVASYGLYNDTTMELLEGFEITANEVKFKYGAGIISNTYVMEEEWIHCSLVFERRPNFPQMYVKVYLNGILSGCAVGKDVSDYTADVANRARFGRICFGARDYIKTIDNVNTRITDQFSDSEFRNIKIYAKSLTAEEIVSNYIADEYYMHADESGSYDGLKNAELRLQNGFDDNKNYSINSINLPRIYIIPKSNTIAGDFKEMSENTQSDATIETYDCHIRYERPNAGSGTLIFDTRDWVNKDVNIIDTTIKVQGTTSLQYNHKNYDICFGKWSNSGQDVLFTPKYNATNIDGDKDWLPENIFTLKADLIDSSHANNVGTAKAISSLSDQQNLNTQLPPMVDQSNQFAGNVKYAIDGFPCLLYVYDNKDKYVNINEPGDASFYGVYMFDLGRTTVNNFGMQNLKINSWADTGGSPCIVSSHEIIKTNAGELYALENTFSFEGSANATDDSSIDFVNITQTQLKNDWELRFPLNEEDKAVISDVAYNALEIPASRAQNYVTDRDGFTDGTWNQTACVVYLLCSYLFGMTDNLGKNLQLRTWGTKKGGSTEWFPMFYDMDTVLGLNNLGELLWDTNIDIDAYGEGQRETQKFGNQITTDQSYKRSDGGENGLYRCKGYYNTTSSRLWNAVRSEDIWGGEWNDSSNSFGDNTLKEVYRLLRRDGKLTYQTLWGYYNSIVNTIGPMLYNEDALIKYLDVNISTNTDHTYSFENIHRLHGSRELLTKRWLRDRLYYLDSLFGVGTAGPATSKYIDSIRNYLTGTPLDVTIKTKCPIFVTMTQGDQNITDIKLCSPNYFGKFDFYTTVGNEINSTLNNAPLISYVRGLYNGLSTINMSAATDLLEVAFPGTTQLNSLNTEGMRSLRSVNLRDCVNLRGALKLSNANFLHTLDISNTSLQEIILPSAGTLRVLNASNTKLSSLTITEQTQLETLNLSDSTQLSVCNISKCDSLEELTITGSQLVSLVVENCQNLKKVILSNNNLLTNVSFTGCPNVQIVDLSGCQNTQFAQYTENQPATGPASCVDLSSLENLEVLNLSNSSAQVVMLSDNAHALTDIDASDSQWMQTVYKTSTGFMYGMKTFNSRQNNPVVPVIDLSRFKNLQRVTFKGNAYVKAIDGLIYAGPTSQMFYQCRSLYSVSGEITFTQSSNQMFAYTESNLFRLNESYSVTPTPNNISQLSGLNLTLKISENSTATSFTSMFATNYGITLNDAYYFCSCMNNKVTNMTSCFNGTYLQRTELTNLDAMLYEGVLANCKGLVNANYMFYSSGLTGIFPSKVLQPCSNLNTVANMFMFNNFKELNWDFAQEVFRLNTQLTDVSGFLENNKNLTTTEQNAIVLDKLFVNNSKLTSCAGVLGISQTYADGRHNSDNMYMDDTAQRKLYLKFSADNQTDRLFSNTPNLTSCARAFAKCKFATGQYIDENIFGGVYGKDASGNQLAKDGKPAAFPITKITNIAYCFHDCDATLVFTNKIFSKLTNLENAEAFASGGIKNRLNSPTTSRCDKVTGDISTLSSIFINNTALKNVNRFFESTGVNGVVPSGDLTNNSASPLFAFNSLLTHAEYLFRDSKISGNVPSLLFGKCQSLTSVRGLFYNTNVSGSLPGTGSRSSQIMFKNLIANDGKCADLKDASYLFYSCENLSTNLPDNLFLHTPSITTLACCFYNCGNESNVASGITGSIPKNLLSNLTQLLNVAYMFKGCYNIVDDGTVDNIFVPVELFKNNVEITTFEGLFENVPVTKIAEGAFANQTKLQTVARMFANSNRTNLEIPTTSFYNCSLIKNINNFIGDDLGVVLKGSIKTFSNYFKPHDGQFGQYKIEYMDNAFANNPSAVWDNPANAMNFWDTSVWPSNISHNRCYANCTSLQNWNNIPIGYGGPLQID